MKITKVNCKEKIDDKKSKEIECSEDLISTCPYEDAINLIMGAIESLSVVAKDDPIAKDSIANLGVVVLDLKGGC